MKKSLLAAAAVAAFAFTSASAQTIWLLGSGDGLTWDLPGAPVQINGDGNYELNLLNLTKFKFSSIEATDWDTYNSGAYATGDVTFNSSVYPNGQTLPLVPWGEDQELPWTGDYKITIKGDFSEMTVVALTPEPTTAPDVFIRGAMNDWGASADWQFTYRPATDDYVFVVTEANTIGQGVAFKIADANWGNINYSTPSITPTAAGARYDLDFNKGDMTSTVNFYGSIIFKITAPKTAYAIFTLGDMSGVDEVGVEEGEAVYYNLQGARVLNPERGIFVKVQNGKALKVVR